MPLTDELVKRVVEAQQSNDAVQMSEALGLLLDSHKETDTTLESVTVQSGKTQEQISLLQKTNNEMFLRLYGSKADPQTVEEEKETTIEEAVDAWKGLIK